MKRLILFISILIIGPASIAVACPELPEGYDIQQIRYKITRDYRDILFEANFPKLSELDCNVKNEEELHFDLSNGEISVKITYKQFYTGELLKTDSIPLLVFYRKHLELGVPALRGLSSAKYVETDWGEEFLVRKIFNFSPFTNEFNSNRMPGHYTYHEDGSVTVNWIASSYWRRTSNGMSYVYPNLLPDTVQIIMY